MKKLIIFLLTAFFPITVLAAHMVQGTVPDVQPLQPPAVGVENNASGNIEYHYNSNFTGQSGSTSPANVAAPAANQIGANQVVVSSGFVQSAENHSLVAGILFVVLVAGVAIVVRKYLR